MLTISEKLEKAVELIESHFQNWTTPSFFVQFGTGFAADLLFDEEPQSLELSKLPNMPDYHNPDFEHPSLLYGLCMGVPVLALRGHRHLYEGLGTYPCVFPICTAWKLGIRRHVFIEGALSLRTELKPGTWTMLTDYINGHGVSPLDGLHHLLNTPFPDMMDALSQHQNSEFINAFAERGIDPRLCVYMSRPGSQFCTVAEAEASRQSGADIVGHDLVMEIIMAHALECNVSAFALVAESAPIATSRPLHRRNILDNCNFCSSEFMRAFRPALQEIDRLEAVVKSPVLPSSEAEDILFNDFHRPSGKPPKLKLLKKQE